MTNKDEDQDWLGALAGKLNADADPEVTRRATALRQAIQRHDATLGANDFDVEAGLQKLKLRLYREGLGVSPVLKRTYSHREKVENLKTNTANKENDEPVDIKIVIEQIASRFANDLRSRKQNLLENELSSLASYFAENEVIADDSWSWLDKYNFSILRDDRYSARVIVEKIKSIWNPLLAPRFSGVRFSESSSWIEDSHTWRLHMTSAFHKCLKGLDMHLREQVLDAITDISEHPIEIRGDIVKPLDGEIKGFWQYCIGAYRIIYFADVGAKRIDLISVDGSSDTLG